jgi:hypothetical protein
MSLMIVLGADFSDADRLSWLQRDGSSRRTLRARRCAASASRVALTSAHPGLHWVITVPTASQKLDALQQSVANIPAPSVATSVTLPKAQPPKR